MKTSRRSKRRSVWASLVSFASFFLALGAHAQDNLFPPWLEDEARIEQALVEGEVLSIEPIGHGVTNPFRVELVFQGRRMAAVWKPIDPANHRVAAESYQAEVAAYKLSRFVGLNAVPPTVERKINRQNGSLQYWVEGASIYADVEDSLPSSLHFRNDIARMRIFDRVILNPDRNSGNFLVDADGRIVLIDHSRALSFDAQSRAKKRYTPKTFDRSLVERLKTLELAELAEELSGLLPKHRIKAMLKERDRLIADVEKAVAQHGEVIFFN